MIEAGNKKKWWIPLVHFLVIISVIVCLFIVVNSFTMSRWKRSETPSGWQIVAEGFDVRCMAESGECIWAGGKNGLIAISKETGAIISDDGIDTEMSYIMSVLVDSEGSVWIAHDAGLTCLKDGSITTWTSNDGLPSSHVKSVGQDAEGRIWAGTLEGAAVRDGDLWTSITTDGGLLDNNINVIFPDSHGGIWFGSYVAPEGGVSYLRDGEWQYFTRDNGLPHPNVTSFMENSAGNIWIGTGFIDRGGTCRLSFDGTKWAMDLTYTQADGLAGPKVRSLCEDSSGGFWFGSEYDGVAYVIDGIWKVFNINNGLVHNEVTSIIEVENGDIWLGTLGGITRITSSALDDLI